MNVRIGTGLGLRSVRDAIAAFRTESGAEPFYYSNYTTSKHGMPPLGPELVTNGGFDSDLSGWTSYDVGTVTWSAGRARFETVGAQTAGRYTTFTTVVGKAYRIRGEYVLDDDAASGQLRVGTSAASSVNFTETFTTDWSIDGYFVATATTTYVTLLMTSADDVAFFDDISVKLLDTTDSATTAAIADALSISKGSAKYVLNSSGSYTQVASGSAPAISYDPVSGATAQLVEDASTNIFNYSAVINGVALDSTIADEDAEGAVAGQKSVRIAATNQSGAQTPYWQAPIAIFATGKHCYWWVC